MQSSCKKLYYPRETTKNNQIISKNKKEKKYNIKEEIQNCEEEKLTTHYIILYLLVLHFLGQPKKHEEIQTRASTEKQVDLSRRVENKS